MNGSLDLICKMNSPTQKIPIMKFLAEKKNPTEFPQTQIFCIKHFQQSVLISSFKRLGVY